MAEAVQTARDGAAPSTTLRAKLAPAFKDAGIASLIALALSVPLLSERTVQQGSTLVLQNRWWLAFTAMCAVFAGRLVLNLLREGEVPDRLSSALGSAGEVLPQTDFSRWLAPVMIVFALALPFMPFSDRYIMDVSILVLTYVMLGWGLNIV
ncbi:unnamed protein product, partial [marine sediment metagenome]